MEYMDPQFWIQVLVPPIIGFIGTLIGAGIAIWQVIKRKDAERKAERRLDALKDLLGAADAWKISIQSVSSANSVLLDKIRKKDLDNIAGIEAAIDSNGSNIYGLHVSVTEKLEKIKELFKEMEQ